VSRIGTHRVPVAADIKGENYVKCYLLRTTRVASGINRKIFVKRNVSSFIFSLLFRRHNTDIVLINSTNIYTELTSRCQPEKATGLLKPGSLHALNTRKTYDTVQSMGNSTCLMQAPARWADTAWPCTPLACTPTTCMIWTCIKHDFSSTISNFISDGQKNLHIFLFTLQNN
jgi:hypothetical protein